MNITCVRVYGLEESIVASGLPMIESYSSDSFENNVDNMRAQYMFLDEIASMDVDRNRGRAKKLASCKGGESHDCFLCGIIVQMNVTAPRYWWPEFQRYHFADIVSSTSTMHKLKAFATKVINADSEDDKEEIESLILEHFSKYTNMYVTNAFMDFVRSCDGKDIDINELKANLPDGWLQTARVTTNYRALKTIYRQRNNHALNEWHEFCRWIDTLPMSEMITGGNGK